MLTLFKARRTAPAASKALHAISHMNSAALADIGMDHRGANVNVAAFDLQWALARSTGG